MKLSKKDANLQIRRLEHFLGAPKTDGGWLDSTDALIRYCRDLDHCKAVIAGYVDSPRLDDQGNPRFPSVYDIRLLCHPPQEYKSPAAEDLTQQGWFIRDLANRPDMIQRWKRMATATHNSAGYPLREDQRQFAAGIVRQVEDHLGQAV